MPRNIIERSIYRNYHELSNKYVNVTCLIIFHEGLSKSINLINDGSGYQFDNVILPDDSISGMLSKAKFDFLPFTVDRSSLDFHDAKAILNITIYDGEINLVNSFRDTRGFDKGGVVIFDCLFTDMPSVYNIRKYNIFSTFYSKSTLRINAGVRNLLDVMSVPITYNEENSPGLF